MSSRKYAPRFARYAPGIRLQDARNAAFRNWWAKRWTDSLVVKDLAGRFGRGRVYAMNGQVMRLSIAPPGPSGVTVTADVVGARPGAYCVSARFRVPASDVRERIVSRLKAEPILLARLAARDLPLEIEGIFRAEGLDLFPGGKLGEGLYDVTSACTCPDYANPCKHTFAALLVLGEEVARNPAQLLALRGISLEELCDEA
jgi:uncharacterized Zn finger protein